MNHYANNNCFVQLEDVITQFHKRIKHLQKQVINQHHDNLQLTKHHKNSYNCGKSYQFGLQTRISMVDLVSCVLTNRDAHSPYH